MVSQKLYNRLYNKYLAKFVEICRKKENNVKNLEVSIKRNVWAYILKEFGDIKINKTCTAVYLFQCVGKFTLDKVSCTWYNNQAFSELNIAE